MSLKVVPFDRSCMVSYYWSLVTLSLKRTVFEIFDLYLMPPLKGFPLEFSIGARGHKS